MWPFLDHWSLQKKSSYYLSSECWAFQRFLQANNPLIKGSYWQWLLEVHPYPSAQRTISTGGESQGAIRQGVMTGRVLQGCRLRSQKMGPKMPVTMGTHNLPSFFRGIWPIYWGCKNPSSFPWVSCWGLIKRYQGISRLVLKLHEKIGGY